MIEYNRKREEATFICRTRGKSAFLAGDFNAWSASDRRMVKAKDGTFRAKLKLPPGKYEYKFVVDGQWIEDPDTDSKSGNPFGTTNSVATVE